MNYNISIVVDFFIWLFSKKGKGCLYGKTSEQKHEFFVSLTNFAKTDPEFYYQQACDLKWREYREYKKWLKDQIEFKKELLKCFEKLNHEKTL